MRDPTTGRHAAARRPLLRRRWRTSSTAARRSRKWCTRPGCSRHRQVHLARPRPARRGDRGRGPGDRQAPPAGRGPLVGALDGYGPVADAILYHHERVDGRGYPAGLIGNEIPLASRILAICCIYDTMTARESYRAADDARGSHGGAAQRRRTASSTASSSRPSSRCSSARARVRTATPTSRPSSNSSAASRDGRTNHQLSAIAAGPRDAGDQQALVPRATPRAPSAVVINEALKKTGAAFADALRSELCATPKHS